MTSALLPERCTCWRQTPATDAMQAELLQFLASLAAVVAIVAAAWMLGSREGASLTSVDEARDLFALAPGGFEPVAIGMDSEGRTAIARDGEGRIAVLVPHGNKFVVRIVPSGTIIRARQGTLEIASWPRVNLTLGEDAGDWATTDRNANRQ